MTTPPPKKKTKKPPQGWQPSMQLQIRRRVLRRSLFAGHMHRCLRSLLSLLHYDRQWICEIHSSSPSLSASAAARARWLYTQRATVYRSVQELGDRCKLAPLCLHNAREPRSFNFASVWLTVISSDPRQCQKQRASHSYRNEDRFHLFAVKSIIRPLGEWWCRFSLNIKCLSCYCWSGEWKGHSSWFAREGGRSWNVRTVSSRLAVCAVLILTSAERGLLQWRPS